MPAPRPAVSQDRFEERAVLSGVGRSAIGRRLMVDPLSLTVDACLAAVADAGLRLEDIDGLSTYPGAGGMGMSEGGVSAVEDALRLHPTWINGGGDLPGPGGSVIAAMLAVASGLCRHVLCFRTVWESTFAALRLGGGGGGRASGWMQWRAPFGAMSAANWIGMNANQYLHRYGATREMLGWIAINGRTNAARNPAAIYRDPMTMDDYYAARPITTPFGLYDCDVPCDASIAVVVSDASVAADLPKPAIRVAAVGTQILERPSWEQGTITHEPQVLGQSAHLWTRTDLRPADVDLALVYDGFTFNAISWLEGLGFCGFGEAQAWLDGGRRIALDGDLPVNPHGGQLSEGRTHGYGFLYEAIDPAPPRGRRAPGRRRRHGGGHLRGRHPLGRAAPPARTGPDALRVSPHLHRVSPHSYSGGMASPELHAPAPRTRAASMPFEERRRSIVDAAIPLLMEHGEQVTTRHVADAAGIAEGTLFRVFPDKDSLLSAVIDRILDPEPLEEALATIDAAQPLADGRGPGGRAVAAARRRRVAGDVTDRQAR